MGDSWGIGGFEGWGRGLESAISRKKSAKKLSKKKIVEKFEISFSD